MAILYYRNNKSLPILKRKFCMRTHLLFFILLSSFAFGQSPAKKYINDPASQHRWLTEYRSFLSIPNVYGDTVNIQRNAEMILTMLKQRGVNGKLMTSDVPDSSPAVFGEVKSPGAKTTVIFYAHYDGQPVNPKQWAEGLEPFTPALFTNRIDKGGKPIPFPSEKETINGDWRLYARGSS